MRQQDHSIGHPSGLFHRRCLHEDDTAGASGARVVCSQFPQDVLRDLRRKAAAP